VPTALDKTFPLLETPGLGTHWWIHAESPVPQGLALSLREELRTLIEDFEARYSRFRPDSELSRLNAAGAWPNPSPEFRGLLERALLLHELTDGLFNAAIGQRMVDLGYDERLSFAGVADPSSAAPLPEVLRLDERGVRLSNGTRLDFGGFGKGALVDKLARRLERRGVAAYRVNGGGDLYVSSPDGQEVFLEHPYATGRFLQKIRLRRGALAASSTERRAWTDARTGDRRHHLAHPTGDAPERIATFVVARSTLTADAAATTLAVAAPADRPRLAKRLGVEYLALTPTALDHSPGWPLPASVRAAIGGGDDAPDLHVQA
jgi:thiamine biosynthesis lipoprotein